jgi:tetratricopeptide (TPR) repeat protein
MTVNTLRKYSIFILNSVLYISSTLAQQPNRDPRQQSVVYQLPKMEQVAIQKDITFKTVGPLQLKMDVYYPRHVRRDERLPVVVFVNGVGDRPNFPKLKEWGQYRDWGKLIAASGFAAITHDSRGEDAIADTSSLLEYVRANAARLNLNEDKILVWSCSANGREAMKIVMEDRPYIRAAVFYYAVGDAPSLLRELPLFIARAGLDNWNLNQGIDNFAATAVAQGLTVNFVNYAEGHHAFDLFDNTDESREIIKRTLEFIKFHLTQSNVGRVNRAPSPARFIALINGLGWVKALEIYERAKQDEPQAPLFTEQGLNNVGYVLLQNKKTREAIEIFKLNVAAYPNSANAYDSLADAYETDNKKSEAIKTAERAIELLDRDTNTPPPMRERIRQSAMEKLQRLRSN